MNSFVQHHRGLIRFGYSCFDRMILTGYLQQFQHSQRAGTIVWFLQTHRRAGGLTRAYFARLSRNYHDWVAHYA